MYLVALTGGIGAGKSTVAHMLADNGALVISADDVAREVVQPGTEVLEKLVDTFGAQILKQDGSLNRQALAEIVFVDSGALGRLNAITHPAIFERTTQLFAQQEINSIVVYDVPLLAETNSQYAFDHVVVVTAPVNERINRLVRDRRMTVESATNRISSQANDRERMALADSIIDTSGSLEQTRARVNALWKNLVELAAHKSRSDNE